MTISDFMQKKNIGIQELASTIGVSESIVRLWEMGAASPRLKHAIRLNQFSKNKIKFIEMLNNKDKGEFLDAKN
jgi:DNA-binding transcriptional regulator YiaG